MLIKIRVKTSSRKETVTKKADDSYEVSVKEEAERNMANKRIIGIFRKLNPGKSVKIIKGHHSPSKIIEIG